MASDLDELEKLLQLLPADEWTCDGNHVWWSDGDLAALVYGNLGIDMDRPVGPNVVAQYIAAANPQTLHALIEEIRRLREHCGFIDRELP